MTNKYTHLFAHWFPLALLFSIISGALTGYCLGSDAERLKPLGDIFLHLIFTAIVPFIFFSVATSMMKLGETKKFWKVIYNMFATFLFTGTVAALFMLCVVKLIPPAQDVFFQLSPAMNTNNIHVMEQMANIITVPDFSKLISHQNMLPLIFFSILVGLATAAAGHKGQAFAKVLESGNEIFIRVMTFIMYYAPIGFFAYFAVLAGNFGAKLFETYLRATLIYYIFGLLYFVAAYTLYAYMANKKEGVKQFWKHIFLPIITALATCSSAASMPANLQAAKKMGVSSYIAETVIPLGTVLHKDGSVLSGILKIAFLFGIFHLNFAGPGVMLTAIIIALLVGTVMGAIPSGGMLGEMLILSLYGFPPQTLVIIAAIGLIVDPLGTVLNVGGNTVGSMLTARLVDGRDWVKNVILATETE